MKRRKRTNSNVPAKGRLRDMADSLWSLAVLGDWNHVCAICGSRSRLNAHHLIPRAHYATRYDLRNGICLCSRCHLFCSERSPHQNAAGFMLWRGEHHERLCQWYTDMMESGEYRDSVVVNAAFLVEVIQALRENVDESERDRILGVRFSAWLDSEESR